MLGVEASERKRNCGEKGSVFVETVALEACSGFRSERTKEGQCVESAGRDAESESAESAFLGSGRGGLHVESAIDSYEEVILQ